MKKEFFKNCNCIEELKKEYHKLAIKHHPDISKDPNATEIMKQINSEYEVKFNELKNVFMSSTGEIYTSEKEVTEAPLEFIHIINELIKLEGVQVELIGRWIWITGNTKEHKEVLKKLNFRWCKNKKAWSWHRKEDNTASRGKWNLNEIREKYNSITFKKSSKTTSRTQVLEEKAS